MDKHPTPALGAALDISEGVEAFARMLADVTMLPLDVIPAGSEPTPDALTQFPYAAAVELVREALRRDFGLDTRNAGRATGFAWALAYYLCNEAGGFDMGVDISPAAVVDAVAQQVLCGAHRA